MMTPTPSLSSDQIRIIYCYARDRALAHDLHQDGKREQDPAKQRELFLAANRASAEASRTIEHARAHMPELEVHMLAAECALINPDQAEIYIYELGWPLEAPWLDVVEVGR